MAAIFSMGQAQGSDIVKDVPAQLNALTNSLEQLEKGVDALYDQLAPVLRPVSEVRSEDEKVEENLVPLADSLKVFDTRIGTLIDRVHGLQRGLQI